MLIRYKYATITEELMKRIKYQITDSVSGESFIVLNKK